MIETDLADVQRRTDEQASSEAYFAADVGWPEPMELPGAMPAVPAFDKTLLPEVLRPWVMDISDRMQCPPDFPAVAAMVVVASVVGRQLAVRPKRQDDWQVIPNLWGAIVGRPGILKSPALQEPMRLLSELEDASRTEFEEALRQYKAREMVDKAARKKAEKEIEAALKNGNEEHAQGIASDFQEQERDPPTRSRYKTSDVTVEKLGELLNENPRGILVFRDELTGWLSSLDKDGREGSRQFFLEAWNGDGSFTFDRIGRGTVEIEAASVSMLGGIQPGPLRQYLRTALKGGAGDDGLLQRLQLIVWPDAPKTFVNIDRRPDTDARAAVRNLLRRLDSIDPKSCGATDAGDDMPFLRFNGDAQECFDQWRADLEGRLRGDDLSPALESHLSKYRSLVPSLALLFHLLDGHSAQINKASLLRALSWAEYLEGHAGRVYSSCINPEVDSARELARHISRGKVLSVFTARDIYKKGWAGLGKSEVTLALRVLEDHDYVRAIARPSKPGKGGAPTTDYEINPWLEVSGGSK